MSSTEKFTVKSLNHDQPQVSGHVGLPALRVSSVPSPSPKPRWESQRSHSSYPALASDSHVSASTQNQALNALMFFYHEVLEKRIGLIQGVVRAKRSQRLPVVLTKEEVKRVLSFMDGMPWLMAMLLYGAGLRLMECCRLRVKDIDFSQNQIVVRAGKGNKDRYTMLPAAAKKPLFQHLQAVKREHEEDLRQGLGRVSLPYALERKYPNAGKE